MGRPPRSVRGHFLDFPKAACEDCIRKQERMPGPQHVREELGALEKDGFLVRDAGRCGLCHQNGVVWRRAG